jgi:transposase
MSVINPRMARDFARAIQELVKTDGIDAATLAEVASVQARRRALHPPGQRAGAAGSGRACEAPAPTGGHAAL